MTASWSTVDRPDRWLSLTVVDTARAFKCKLKISSSFSADVLRIRMFHLSDACGVGLYQILESKRLMCNACIADVDMSWVVGIKQKWALLFWWLTWTDLSWPEAKLCLLSISKFGIEKKVVDWSQTESRTLVFHFRRVSLNIPANLFRQSIWVLEIEWKNRACPCLSKRWVLVGKGRALLKTMSQPSWSN